MSVSNPKRLTKRQQKVVEANQGLVHFMCKRFPSGFDEEELLSAGQFALMNAARKFDPNRGFKFSTFACRSIYHAFLRESQRQMRVRKIQEKENILSERTIDHRENGHESTMAKEVMDLAMRELPERERFIVHSRFVNNWTLKETGDAMGLSNERVRQIQKGAMERLRYLTGAVAA